MICQILISSISLWRGMHLGLAFCGKCMGLESNDILSSTSVAHHLNLLLFAYENEHLVFSLSFVNCCYTGFGSSGWKVPWACDNCYCSSSVGLLLDLLCDDTLCRPEGKGSHTLFLRWCLHVRGCETTQCIAQICPQRHLMPSKIWASKWPPATVLWVTSCAGWPQFIFYLWSHKCPPIYLLGWCWKNPGGILIEHQFLYNCETILIGWHQIRIRW